MSFTDRYRSLNDAQKQAVDTIEGPVMVIAGPGTGKTELLSVRVANILQKTDTLPENILCLTFTESGQAAMRERLVGIIGKDAYKVAIHTFHSFGSEIIAQNREHFYRGALFSPADDIKQYEAMRAIFETLDRTNPLASMMNGEYTHLRDAQKVISELKRGTALTSDEFLAVLEQSDASLDTLERILVPVFSERVSKTTGAKLEVALAEIQHAAEAVESLYATTPLLRVVHDSLAHMIELTESVHPTKPISAWKTTWFERNDQKQLVFKDRKRLAKLKAVAYIYYEYLNSMEKAGLYDYDDMIMQVVHAMEVNNDLKYNLQEKYLYVMVDEFQDTNLAQLRILHSLTDNPVNEGSPNVLVVGDDDQAVYGFQGADVSNILSFSDTYPTRRLIVLTENYRSGEAILRTSRAVITQGDDRLESRIGELNKELRAHKTAPGSVALWSADTIDDERFELARRIQQQIQQGTSPSDIAVLARRHTDIQSLLPFFRHAGVPIRYEREESVLDTPPIKALEQLARLIIALAEARHDDVQQLLPEVLMHPAWKLSAPILWRLSLTAYTNRQQWMEVMETTPELTEIHTWLIERAIQAKTTALEPMIDALIGYNDTTEYKSPYFMYYFSTDALESEPTAYLDCLNALRAIRTKLHDYKSNESLTLASLVEFIDIHRQLGITLTVRSYSTASDVEAVQLLTAHKSKGLEFNSVYIFNAVDSVWGHSARSVSRSISYPENLPLAPAGNSADERLRLFYVAMTRAKNELVISFSEANESGKRSLLADFLLSVTEDEIVNDAMLSSNRVVTSKESAQVDPITIAELAWHQPLTQVSADLKTLLAPQLEKFKLSATSLNNFLDVTRGGPKQFLLSNLLHFPQAKGASAAYGTAIHRALQQAHVHLQATGEMKPLEDILHDFEVALENERLAPLDFQHYLQQGSEHLPQFLTSGVLPMNTRQKAEVGFSYQDVRVGDARLTGSLDMIEIDTDARTMLVTDYKTGRPAISWDKGDEHTKLKLHKYRQQLLFYKILVENSSEYSNYTVDGGRLAFIQPTKSGDSIVLSLEFDEAELERTKQLLEASWKCITSLELPDTSHYSVDLKGVLAFEQDLIDGLV